MESDYKVFFFLSFTVSYCGLSATLAEYTVILEKANFGEGVPKKKVKKYKMITDEVKFRREWVELHQGLLGFCQHHYSRDLFVQSQFQSGFHHPHCPLFFSKVQVNQSVSSSLPSL